MRTSSPKFAKGHQNRGHHARLLGSRQAHRPVAEPQTGHRRRLGASFHVIFKEFPVENPVSTFTDYVRRTTDFPCWCCSMKRRRLQTGRFLRASDLTGQLGQDNNPEWKTIALDELSGELVSP